MKRLLLASLVLGLGASAASAAPLQLQGSDTLFDWTQYMLDHCPGIDQVNNLNYKGGGSGTAELAMPSTYTPLQQIGPMSKKLSSGASPEFNNYAGLGRPSQGIKVALDAIGILVDNEETNTCNTAVYSKTITVLDKNGGGGVDDGAATPVAGCDGCVLSGSDYTYTFEDWREPLRIIYGGQSIKHTQAQKDGTKCSENPISRSNISTRRCNSDLRRTLADNWEAFFEESACNGTDADNCQQIRHVFRRDDASGTTDVFLETLGLPKIVAGAPPFCNGAEMEDEDPIRRDCSESADFTGDEQVCNSVAANLLNAAGPATASVAAGWHGGPISNPPNANAADLGLVLSIVIPESTPSQDPYQALTAGFPYCSTGAFGGSFRYAPMPQSSLDSLINRCPEGNKRVGGSNCQWPAFKDAGGAYHFGCINKKTNVPAAKTIANIDGRVYNLIARNNNGSMQTIRRGSSNVAVHHSMYRIHTTQVMPGGTFTSAGNACQFIDATDQIGCLVHASPCSIGYSGLGADNRDPNKILALRTNKIGCETDLIDNDLDGTVDETTTPEVCTTIYPSVPVVRRLVNSTATCGTQAAATAGQLFDQRYPLGRVLYYNSTKGFNTAADTDPYHFANIADTFDEKKLAACAADQHYADDATNAVGFVTLDDDVCATAGLGMTMTEDCRMPIFNY